MGTDLVVDPFQLNFVGDFDAQVNNVLKTVRLTRQEVEDLRRLFIDLERSLQNAWRECKVMPFGSIVTGLGITSSDVDVFVHVPDDYDHDQAQLVLTARRMLRRRPMLYHQPFAITTAKVPIVKFHHIPTRRCCDVSFKSPSGVRNSQLIAHLLHSDRRALPFTIIIKYWSKVHKLTGTNLIPNYALTMLSIFFLQQKHILPPIIRLQSPNNSFYVDDWNTAFNEKYVYKTENNHNLYELLGEFFKFYSTFNFEENIISPYMGKPIARELFKNMENIPKEFDLYKRNINSKGCFTLKTDTTMCVQDTFEHNRNCTVAVFPRLAQRFVLHAQLGAKIFEDSKSTDFLRDILIKKPIIPQGNKKNKKNKDSPKNRVLSNTNDKDKNEENYEKPNDAESHNNVEISTKLTSFNDKDNSPNNTDVPDNTVITNTQVPASINRPKKRTLHNNLADLYRKTKRRKI